MFRGTPSPIFDVPEFPTLRRIKPLPKRRRTSGPENSEPFSPITSTSQNISPANLQTLSQQQWQQPTPSPLDTLNPNIAADELLPHADNLSTRMALQNYYLPILGNVQHFLADQGRSNGNNSTSTLAAAAALVAVTGDSGNIPSPLADLGSIEFGVHLAAAAAAAVAAGVPMSGLGNLGMGLANMNMGMSMGDTTSTMTGAGKVDSGEADRSSPSLQASNATLSVIREAGTPPGCQEEGSIRGQDEYIDHVFQPGNTKKRKVPANVGGSPRGVGNTSDIVRPASPPLSYLDEEGLDGHSGVGGFADAEGIPQSDGNGNQDRDRDYDSTLPPPPAYPPPPFPGQMSMLKQRKGKLTAVTFAGLQHKEILKVRKRQLASVMGSLSFGDTLALDQALSVNYSLASRAADNKGEQLKIRKSTRRAVRLTRVVKAVLETPERKNRHPDAVPFPTSDFVFKCSCDTAERSIITKEEVATLRRRLDSELQRRATSASNIAAASDGDSKVQRTSGRAKRERRERERERAAKAERQKKANAGSDAGEQAPESLESKNVFPAIGSGTSGSVGVETGGKSGKAKNGKKKRSALANASNPHHLRNYVPSRLPHSGPPDGAPGQHGAVGLWPLPMRFLAAEAPSRTQESDRKRPPPSTPLTQLTQPTEEWICAFCEYDLFYGNEDAYRRAVRNRKKILRRRKRAAERAAAAASGTAGNSTAKVAPSQLQDEDYDGHERVAGNQMPGHGDAAIQRSVQWKGSTDKEPTAYG